MRINRFLALGLGISRRAADSLVLNKRVLINGQIARPTDSVEKGDVVMFDGNPVTPSEFKYVIFNKPPGYITSCARQGKAPTIYKLLPEAYHHLKPVGRLDKDSRGLLLLTSDGELANKLTHPRYQKIKTYKVKLNKDLPMSDLQKLNSGVELADGISRLQAIPKPDHIEITISEGRNRQIRRTFDSLGYKVVFLQRVKFGNLELNDLKEGDYREIKRPEIIK